MDVGLLVGEFVGVGVAVLQTMVMEIVLLVAGPPPAQVAVPWSLTTWQESLELKE